MSSNNGLEASGQHAMDLVFHGVALAQVGDPHLVAGLADALDAALALLQKCGVQGKCKVDQGAESLQVEACRRRRRCRGAA